MIGDQEGFWSNVHYGFGVAFGLVGIGRERAETLMGVWEITEPGIWNGWGTWGVYQGREHFEGGQSGRDFDMQRGLEGYDDASCWRWWIEQFLLPGIP